MDLAGKTAVVTGASSGIGAATTRLLRGAGVRVAGGARRTERIDADVALQLDVTDEASSRAFVDAAVEALGGIDILFNNAGLALTRVPFDESTEDVEATVLHTNVDGVLRITRLCLPHIRDEGHILFMGSVAGRQAYPHGASYIASKFAVRGFSYALREDLLGRPIRVTTVDAGLVETEFSLVRFGGDREKADAVYEGVDPVTPEEVAECVLFALTRPLHVNLDEIVIKALAQSSGARVVRRTLLLLARPVVAAHSLVAAAPDREAGRLGVLHEGVACDRMAGLVDRDRPALPLDVLDADRRAGLERRDRPRPGPPSSNAARDRSGARSSAPSR